MNKKKDRIASKIANKLDMTWNMEYLLDPIPSMRGKCYYIYVRDVQTYIKQKNEKLAKQLAYLCNKYDPKNITGLKDRNIGINMNNLQIVIW
jgi:hypothetical protein